MFDLETKKMNFSTAFEIPETGEKDKKHSIIWIQEIQKLVSDNRTKTILCFILINLISFFILLYWFKSTKSITLFANICIISFNILSLVTALITIWVHNRNLDSTYTFGYERFEVLALFTSSILIQISSIPLIKESVERIIFYQPVILTDYFVSIALTTLLCQLLMVCLCKNSSLEYVLDASSSNWLQEHVSDVCQSLCSLVPTLSPYLLPRINPLFLVSCFGTLALLMTYFFTQFRDLYIIDSLCGLWLALMIFFTIHPISVYSGKVLLQTTPTHIIGQLDKCLRETLIIDGVLEFRNEHFWTYSFGKMAGSLEVRVSRSANEQLVLAHVVDRLSDLVDYLTVQLFKDNWSQPLPAVTRSLLTPIRS